MASAACAAFNCDNECSEDKKQKGVTFHRFPLDKPNILAKWLTAMQMPKWTPLKHHFLCSQHFSEDMFIEKENYRFLKYDAVPTMFHVLPQPKVLFPSEWPFKILTEKEVTKAGSKGYVIEAKIALSSEVEFKNWLKQHEALAKVNYIQLHKKPGKNLSFNCEYGCRHLSGKKSSLLESNCPTKLLVRIRVPNITPRLSIPSENVSNYQCTVVLYHLHNHKVESNILSTLNIMADDVSDDVKAKFVEMFKGSYTPELALSTHQTDLLEEFPDDYEKLLSDHYVCPSVEWIANFYETYTSENGIMTDEKFLISVQREISMINGDRGKAKLKKVGDDIVIAVCSSLMERTHSLKSSGETVFVDSCFLIRSKCFIYILMAYSCTEGLPLGVLITTSDKENVLLEGFKLLGQVLPGKAFGQYGPLGPEIFLTANCDAEQKNLKAVFPESTLLLCSFNLLKALWWWLWDEKNGIEDEDKCVLFSHELKIMKTKNQSQFAACYEAALKNDLVKKYENFQAYIKEMNDLSARWAVCFKNELVDKEKDLSAIEMSSLVLKDKVYLTKCYSIPQLLRFLVTDMESYYREKMIHCINNTAEKFIQSSYKPEMRTVDDLEVELLPTGQYKVFHRISKRSYFVDMNMYICSCSQGLLGSRCKHQFAVCTSNKLNLASPVPDDETIRKELHWIATNSMNSLFSKMGRDPRDSEYMHRKMDDEEYDPKQDIQRRYVKQKPKKVPTPKEEAKSILDRVVKDILQRYEKNPEEYHKAIVAAAVNYQGLQFDNTIIAALKAFGKK